MKIWVLSHYFRPEVNAPATRMYDHATRWAAAGHDVTIITCVPNCPDGVIYDGYRSTIRPQFEQIDGVKTVRVWTWIEPNAGTLRRFTNHISYCLSAMLNRATKSRPDVIVATTPQFFCGLAGAALSVLRRVPLVLDVRDIWPESILKVNVMKRGFAIRTLEWLERWMYARAKHIVTVTEGCAEDIQQKVRHPEKVSVITNGVDVSAFTPREPCPRILNDYDLKDKFVCSYVGTIGIKYDFDSLITIARKLREGGIHDVVICMVGDGSARASLESAVRTEGLSPWFRFLGRQDRDSVYRIMSSTDLFLIPLPKDDFFRGTLPFKMFECMAMSRPVLLAGEGEPAEVVRQSRGGIVVAPEDGAAMFAAIMQLKDDPQLRQALSGGRELVLRRFSVDALAGQYLQVLSEAAERPVNVSRPLASMATSPVRGKSGS